MFLSRNLRFYIASAVVAFSAQSYAGAFQLWEQDAGGIGTYHAGGAAESITAASEFYNPASMTNLKYQQVSFGTAVAAIDVNYTGSVSTPYTQSSVTNVPGDTVNFIPNLHYVLPFANKWAFGFGVTTPFGLETDYPKTFPVDNLATKTDLETLNLNPSIAYAFNNFLSIGAGLDFLYGKAIYNSAFDMNNAFLGVKPISATLTGWNTGYNLGALFNISKATRLGVSYRSDIRIDAKGSSSSDAFNSGSISSTASAVFPLPATTILSLYHDFNSRFSLMGSAFYTQWSVFKQLIIRNLATPVGAQTVALNENYKNTWNLSVGGRYKLAHNIVLNAGFGHDETPTRSDMRDIRLPDNNRYAGALGLDIQPSKGFLWSMGWTHFFVPNTSINNTNSNDASQTSSSFAKPAIGIGTSKGEINVFGMQLSCNI